MSILEPEELKEPINARKRSAQFRSDKKYLPIKNHRRCTIRIKIDLWNRIIKIPIVQYRTIGISEIVNQLIRKGLEGLGY